MLPLRQLACLHAHEHLARTRLRVHPYIARVLLVHACFLKRLPHLLQTCVHARGELTGNTVLAGIDRQLDAPLAVMILRIKMACASFCIRLTRLVASPRGFGLDACRLAFGVPSLALRGLRIARGLLPCLRIATRSHHDTHALEAQTLPREGIQKLAVVGNKQPDTPIARKRPENGLAREDIHVVGRLVHDEHVGLFPKRHGNLQTLLLAN